MGVPEEVRAVSRPPHTVVVDNGRDGPNRYAVREVASVKRVEGKKNPQPRLGRTIGHIIDGEYVEIVSPTHKTDEEGNRVLAADSLEYGFPVLIRRVVRDIETDLLKIYPARSVYEMLAIATIRVTKPGVPNSRLRFHYEKSFVSLQYPGIPMSPKTIHNLFEEIGANMDRRLQFSRLRFERVAADHHIAIDGMLTQDNGTVNDLGSYTGKSRIKGRMEISILYAYDIELKEPLCGEVFPGNYVDSNAYLPFLEHNNITKGILVDDKGFLPSKIAELRSKERDLHYLTPIKRNDSRIKEYNMLDWEGVLTGYDHIIYYKKVKTNEGYYLYSFRDLKRAQAEDALFGVRAVKNGNFDAKKHKEKEPLYGVIVFESDVDLAPELVYQVYDNRWELEVVFREYKSDLDLDVTRVQGDFTVIGSEFVNFIAVLITSRILAEIRKTDLFKSRTYASIRDSLNYAWRVVNAPDPMTFDNYWIHVNNEDFEILEKLGISAPNPDKPLKPKGKRKKIKPPAENEPDQQKANDNDTAGRGNSGEAARYQ